jgi:DNA-binding response OmpR family regulator
VPVLLVTALTAREDRIQGIAAGCDDFITKPVDEEQLLARVKSALRTKALIDELEQAENVLVSLANALDAKDPYTRGPFRPRRALRGVARPHRGPRRRRLPRPAARRPAARHRQDRDSR